MATDTRELKRRLIYFYQFPKGRRRYKPADVKNRGFFYLRIDDK